MGTLVLASCPAWASPADREGALFEPWQRGRLDVHQISTGRGNAALVVFPDGTSLLIDAGASRGDVPDAAARPSEARSPGEWIARYVRHMLRQQGEPVLDYALITHFHPDHMGWASDDDPAAAEGPYRLRGLTRVAEEIPIRALIDRAWPDYDYPYPLDRPPLLNYRRFVEWQRANRGMRAIRARAGSADQVALRETGAFPSLEVRIVAANGEVWTGAGDDAVRHFPPDSEIPEAFRPTENLCSIALRIRYGRFDFYTGGDLHGVPDPGEPPWHNMEIPVAAAIGPTDVHVVNHHGSIDPASPELLAALRPRVHIIPTWRPSHPAPVVLKRILTPSAYEGERDVFTTALRESTRIVIGPRTERLASANGHVVVRVEPGGEQYRVVVLDDSTESYRVTSVHGPYAAR